MSSDDDQNNDPHGLRRRRLPGLGYTMDELRDRYFEASWANVERCMQSGVSAKAAAQYMRASKQALDCFQQCSAQDGRSFSEALGPDAAAVVNLERTVRRMDGQRRKTVGEELKEVLAAKAAQKPLH